MELEHIKSQHTAADGINLFIQGWMPDSSIKAIFCLVHGLGEHGGRYSRLAQIFAEEKISLLTLDLHGHGKSGGVRGHISSYKVLMDDINILLKEAKNIFKEDIPVFLYGHSMGGNLVLNYVLRENPNIKGLIVSAPWLEMKTKPSFYKLFMGWAMSYVWPKFTQSNGIDKSQLTHCKNTNKEYIDDPLVHDRISAGLFMEVYRAGKWAMQHAEKLNIPTLLMHGTADQITSLDASKKFARTAGSKCSFKALNDYYHEIHNENNREEYFSVIKDWIENQLG